MIIAYSRMPVGGGGGGAFDSEVIADAPIHRWRCNDSSGNIIDTGVTGGWDLDTGQVTAYGVASLIPSDPGDKAISFNGASNQAKWDATLATIPSLLTIECLLNLSGVHSNNGICGAWSGGATGTMLAFVGANALRFYTDGGFLAGPTLSTGVDYHIVATWDGTNRRIYIDGSLVAGPTAGISPTASPGLGWQLSGYQGNGFYLNGVIDEVALYDFALSGARAAAHFAAL